LYKELILNMKKFFLLVTVLCCSCYAFGQLGKTKPEMLAELGEENVLKESAGKPGYSGLLFKLDSTQFMQATFRGEQAVMLSYFNADSLLSEQHYKGYLAESLPGFVPQKTCRLGDKTYLLNPGGNQLVVQTHRDEDSAFPLIGLILVNDPAIIRGLSEKVGRLCE
jgi:hypothetical protein